MGHAFGPYVFDPARRQVLRDGTPVVLGTRAIALLEALLDADGGAVSKSALMDAAWPGTIVEEVNLSVQIAALRKALGTQPDGQESIATVPRVGYRLPLPAAPQAVEPQHSGPATIAVLPFENLSDDPQQSYFADGIAEDIITALSRFRTFAVVARNSSFVYKGRAVDVREAARELGVRYVLEGSVRRAGDRVRVTAQLVEGDTATHLWAEKFDGPLDDIFEVQDRITEGVVGLVEPTIRRAEIERARSKRPENLDAYDLYLQALPHFYGASADGFIAAIGLLERAIALDPGFAPAMAYAAWAYEKRETIGLPPLRPGDHDRCGELVRLALKAGGDNPQVVGICGYLLGSAMIGDKPAGLAAARRALDANPNNVLVLNCFGLCNLLFGDLDAAEAALLRACDLSPGAPELFESLALIGSIHMFRGNYEETIDWSLRALATSNEWQPIYWNLASAYAYLGRMDEARAMIGRLQLLTPDFTVDKLRRTSMNASVERGEVFAAGLLLAGLPES